MASIINAGTTTLTPIQITGDTSGILQLQTNGGTTAVTIDTAQNVGVGVTPSAWYSAIKSIQASQTSVWGNGGTAGFGSNIYRATSGYTPTYINSNYGGEIIYNLSGGGGWTFNIAPSGTAGATATLTAAMTLDNSGNLLVGTTSLGGVGFSLRDNAGKCLIQQNTSTTAANTMTQFINPNGVVGQIICTGSATAYNTSSDSRLKTLVGVATDTSIIDNIVINDFTWKADGTTDRGVFAQDAYRVKPSAISVGKDKEDGSIEIPWGVDYSKFVPDLIVYCQQLKKQVTELSAKVTALEAKVA